MDTPIYAAVLAEQKFDPASLPPIQTRDEREAEHNLWLDATVAKVMRADLSKQRKPRKKAAS